MKNVDFRPGNMIQKTRNCDQRQEECKSLKYSIIIRHSLVFSEETIVWHKNVQHCHNTECCYVGVYRTKRLRFSRVEQGNAVVLLGTIR